MQYGFMQNISWTYSLHSQVLLNEMQQETNKNFNLASGLNSFNFQDRENVDIRSQLQTLEHHPRWPLLYFTVPDSFCFWPLLLIALVLGSRGCVWVRCCSKHTVLRARSDHVGSFSASSGGHTGCINRQRDESPARVTCYFGCLRELPLVHGRFPSRQLSSLVSPGGEGRLSSHAVTNWRSDSKAAMELLGRMQRSPERLLRSNA